MKFLVCFGREGERERERRGGGGVETCLPKGLLPLLGHDRLEGVSCCKILYDGFCKYLLYGFLLYLFIQQSSQQNC